MEKLFERIFNECNPQEHLKEDNYYGPTQEEGFISEPDAQLVELIIRKAMSQSDIDNGRGSGDWELDDQYVQCFKPQNCPDAGTESYETYQWMLVNKYIGEVDGKMRTKHECFYFNSNSRVARSDNNDPSPNVEGDVETFQLDL